MKKASNNIPSAEKTAILSLLRKVAASETELDYQNCVKVLQSSELYQGKAKEHLRQFVERQWLPIHKVSESNLTERLFYVYLVILCLLVLSYLCGN